MFVCLSVCRRIVVIIGFVIFSTVISIDILAQRLFLRLFHRFTMTQETDASHLTAESAPANEDDTASSDGNSDIEAAASAPHSPFSSDVGGDALYEWPCCGPYARDPGWAEPPPSNPDYGNRPAPPVFNSTGATRRWPKGVPYRCPHEPWTRIARSRVHELVSPIGAQYMNRAGTGVDPHRVHEQLMDISRQGLSAESARSSATAASSWERSAVSARPPTTVPQPKVIYKTPPGYNPPKAPQPGGSPPFNAPPASAPPVKAPPSNMPTMAPRMPQFKNPPPKRPPPFAPRVYQGMFGTHGA